MQWIIDNLNYANDRRNCSPAPDAITVEDCHGNEQTLPVCWIVCPVCEGNGSHVNPAIDAGGLTQEDFADDPDFMEQYFRGDFDMFCNACKGRTTIRAVDRDACPPVLLALYDADEQARHDMESERLAEIRAGA